MEHDPGLQALVKYGKDEDFDDWRRVTSFLTQADLDADGHFQMQAGCADCPIAKKLQDIHESGNSIWFDANERSCLAMMFAENVYLTCPAREIDQPKGWRKLGRRLLNIKTVRETMVEEAHRKKPGVELTACGIEPDTEL